MRVEVVATYRPPWRDGAGRALAGTDEDATTMAVAAAQGVLDAVGGARVDRVVVVTRVPALLAGPTAAVIATALGLAEHVVVESHLGGGPAVLDVLASAAPGTLVIGVDSDTPAASAAALTSESGLGLESVGRTEGRLPSRVRAPGGDVRVCDDPRLLRDLGWRQALIRTGGLGEGPSVVVGPPPAAVAGLGGDRRLAEQVGAQGASAPLLALAELAERATVAEADDPDGVRMVAVEDGTATAVVVTRAGALQVIRDEPTPQTDPAAAVMINRPPAVPIPGSAAAYARAFDAKVGFAAGRCECGARDLPPRYLCLACGREDAFTLERLPRTGAVYTAVTIHAPVPGRVTPYSLVIVDVDGAGVRHLAPVTGAPAGSVGIGARGSFVLRRVADREAGPDYGWAFRPKPTETAPVAS